MSGRYQGVVRGELEPAGPASKGTQSRGARPELLLDRKTACPAKRSRLTARERFWPGMH